MMFLKKSIILIGIVSLLPACQSVKHSYDHHNSNKNQVKFVGKTSSILGVSDISNIERTHNSQPENLDITLLQNRNDIILTDKGNPFDVVNEISETKTQNWINRPTEVKAFSKKVPEKPSEPFPVIIQKGEFETTQDFQDRIAKDEQTRLDKITKLENDYSEKIKTYNNSVLVYNSAIDAEKIRRKDAYSTKYWQFVHITLRDVLGNPEISIYQYDADSQIFYAVLSSDKSSLNHWAKIHVPIEQAKFVKQNAATAKPVLSFVKNSNNRLHISKMLVKAGDNEYSTTFINRPNFNTAEHIIRSKNINIPGSYLTINKGK